MTIWYRPAREPGKVPIWYKVDPVNGVVYTSSIYRNWQPSTEFFTAGDLDNSPWCYRVTQVGDTKRSSPDFEMDIDL